MCVWENWLLQEKRQNLMHAGTEPGNSSYSAAANASVTQSDRKPTQGTVALWFFIFFSPSPIPLLSATEPAAAPALISLLQTATLTGSVAPQASAQSLWPPTSTGAKPSQHPSAAHPSVRGYRQRGRLSPPSFTPTPPPPPPAPRSHTLSTVPIIYGWLYL